ncbi:hypothetical protein V9T40_012598 [Parthenolecanium corni]|uniref:Uncharacterized protein n=1 Tax=Parthenolecanium corni TaxID=536013 RepID=A0AAN9TKP8_9HEMI
MTDSSKSVTKTSKCQDCSQKCTIIIITSAFTCHASRDTLELENWWGAEESVVRTAYEYDKETAGDNRQREEGARLPCIVASPRSHVPPATLRPAASSSAPPPRHRGIFSDREERSSYTTTQVNTTISPFISLFARLSFFFFYLPPAPLSTTTPSSSSEEALPCPPGCAHHSIVVVVAVAAATVVVVVDDDAAATAAEELKRCSQVFLLTVASMTLTLGQPRLSVSPSTVGELTAKSCSILFVIETAFAASIGAIAREKTASRGIKICPEAKLTF